MQSSPYFLEILEVVRFDGSSNEFFNEIQEACGKEWKRSQHKKFACWKSSSKQNKLVLEGGSKIVN